MAKAFIEVEWFVNQDEDKEIEWVNSIILATHPDAYEEECKLLAEEYLQGFGGHRVEQNVNTYYRSVLEAHITFHKDYWGEVDADFDWKQIYHTEIEVEQANQDSRLLTLKG